MGGGYALVAMNVPMLPPRIGPSLRVKSLAIENFRVFGERVEIPLADPVVTFHGRNGTGKSTAQVALMIAFHLLASVRASGGPAGDWKSSFGERQSQFGVAPRDRPVDSRHPFKLVLALENTDLGEFLFSFEVGPNTPVLVVSGDETAARILGSKERAQELRTWVSAPFGDASHAFDIVSSRRQISWQQPQFSDVLLHGALAEQLFSLRTSREPRDRESWRYFAEVLGRFDAFKGRVVSIDRIGANSVPQLTFEERGRLILGLEELSSGEQQIVTLLASVMLSRAAVLAIQEPELNLDVDNQIIFRRVLEELVDAGFKDQIIIESHVPSFDGPEVVRFERDERGVRVAKAPSERGDPVLADRARKAGALSHWVTGEGYTRLPDGMRHEMGIERGGAVWFVKGSRAWEAWREDQLASMLGDGAVDGTDE